MSNPVLPFLLYKWSCSGSASSYVTVDTFVKTCPLKGHFVHELFYLRLSTKTIFLLALGLTYLGLTK